MDRNEMGAVLASGGTVLYKGRHIQHHSELPSEAELALDSGTESEALSLVNAQVAKLTAEKEALEKSLAKKAATKADKAEAKDETKADVKEVKEVKEEKEEVKIDHRFKANK